MNRYRRSNPLLALVVVSLTLAFVMVALPWPEAMRAWKPNFVLLVLIYLLTRFPEMVGVGGAWWLGLIYDGVIGYPLGIHALSFALCAALILLNYPRWRLIPRDRQFILALLLTAVEQILVRSSQGMF